MSSLLILVLCAAFEFDFRRLISILSGVVGARYDCDFEVGCAFGCLNLV